MYLAKLLLVCDLMRLCHDCKFRGVLITKRLGIDADINIDDDVLDSIGTISHWYRGMCHLVLIKVINQLSLMHVIHIAS